LLTFQSVKDYQTSLIDGQTTCVETVYYFLKKIAAASHLNAWLEVFGEEALARAEELDKERQNGANPGKLHGVVIGLKDVICFKDHKASASSRILENFTSIYNATAVQRLLDEGAIIIGRHNCDEFAMGSSNENSAFGPVKNAIDEERVPGGSSGGSAVAVQTGTCMVSLGSDTGGSVRQPADFCGIVGLKPSYGAISRYGLIAYASSFDQIGIFGKSVEDVALVLDVIAGADEFDSTVSQKPNVNLSDKLTSKQKYRLCYFKNALDHPCLDPTIAGEINDFILTLQNAGNEVEGIAFDLLDYIVPAYYVLTTAEASSNLSRYDGVKYGHRTRQKDIDLTELYKFSRSEGFGTEVKRRILLGTFVLSEGFYDAYFTKAQRVRKLVVEKTKEIFENFDAIILPTVPAPAYKIGEKKNAVEIYLADIYTVYANLAGLPAISLPLFKNKQGLPFGLQVMTPHYDELTLLRLSKSLMQLKQTEN